MSVKFAKCFVDTNILLYAHDRTTGEKHERAKRTVDFLWHERKGVISTQVLQELAVNLRRKVTPPLLLPEVRDILTDYLAWHVVVNDSGAVLQALALEGRYKISFWDALILQAAETAGAPVVYSEDLADGQTYGSVRVINPLRAPELLGPPT